MSTVLEFYSHSDLQARTNVRAGEQRLGETLQIIDEATFKGTSTFDQRFIIVGVEEDFGVRANHGRGGADQAFQAFLTHFCNLQDNRFFPTQEVAVLGAVVPTQIGRAHV